MLRIRAFQAAVALIAALFAVSAVRAQAPIYDVSNINAYTDSIETQASEISYLREQLSNVQTRLASLGVGKDAADACDVGCDNGCGPAILMETELLFLRFHKGDGVRVGTGPFEQAEYEFEASPRFTLGYVNNNGLGWRARWFDYQHGARAAEIGSQHNVDLYTVDFEVFERFQLNDKWDIEVFGGSRYMGFEEHHTDVDFNLMGNPVVEIRRNLAWGWGGIVGMEARKRVSRNWSLYGRMRFAAIGGDRFVVDNRGGGPGGHAGGGGAGVGGLNFPNGQKVLDFASTHMEISTGSEYSRVLDNGTEVFFRYGGEWINYHAITRSYDYAFAVTEEFDGTDDAGLFGIGFSFGIYR